MKLYINIIITFLCTQILTAQNEESKDIFIVNIEDIKYSLLKNTEKENICIALEKMYRNTKEEDCKIRKEIVDFYIDSVIFHDDIYSTLTAKIFIRSIRLSEIDSTQKNKLLNKCQEGFYNFELIQFIGLINDQRFIECLKNILIKGRIKTFEKEMIINVMARLGDKNAIRQRINEIKSEIKSKPVKLDIDFTNKLNNLLFINSKELYRLLFDFIDSDNNKIVYIGDYGDGEIIYCSLSTYSIELLSKVIVDFPIKNVICNQNKATNKQKESIHKWLINNNNDFQYIKWHLYYGTNYKYWLQE